LITQYVCLNDLVGQPLPGGIRDTSGNDGARSHRDFELVHATGRDRHGQ
jgi:hypothetical protein